MKKLNQLLVGKIDAFAATALRNHVIANANQKIPGYLYKQLQ